MKNLTKLAIAIVLLTGIFAMQGVCFAYTISGKVYDRDNISGLSGMDVNLLDNTGTTINSIRTTSNGTYSFTNLPEGNYTIKPEHYIPDRRPWYAFSPEQANIFLDRDTTQDFYRINRPPEIDAIPNQTIEEGRLLEFVLTARWLDPTRPAWRDPDVDRISYSCITGLPEGAYLDSERGEFKWAPNYTQARVYNLTFIGTDSYGGESQAKTMTITVLDKPRGPLTIVAKEPDDNSIKTQGPAPCAFKFEVENLPEEFIPYATKPFTFWWDFGDKGGMAHWPSPGHIYSESDTYTVTLKLTDTNFNVLYKTTTTVEVLAELEPINTYYVAPGGDDEIGDGSEGNPWQTIQKGVSMLKPGDRLYIRAGTYKLPKTEQYAIPVPPGTRDKPIWISGYPGERPYLDGTDSKHVAQLTYRVGGEGYVIFENLEIYCPNYAAIMMWSRHITLRNNIINGSLWAFMDSANWGLIYNNLFQKPGYTDVLIHYKSNYGVIKNNTITETGSGIEGSGIDQKAGTAYNQIFHNTLYNLPVNNWRHAGIKMGGAQSFTQKYSRFVAEAYDTIAHDNLIYNTNHTAIQFRASLRCSAIHNTIVVGNPPSNQGDVEKLISVMSDYALPGARPGSPTGGNDPLDFPSKDTLILNNIVVGRENYDDNYIYVVAYNEEGLRSSNNLFWPADGSKDMAFYWMHQGSTPFYKHSTFNEYQQLSGQDLNSITLDPKFVSLTENDFHLTDLSSAIDAGFNLPVSGVDFDGNQRLSGVPVDIGAYEYIPDLVTYYIQGKVVDKFGNGISGVSIDLSGKRRMSTQTNTDGTYQLSSVVAGDYLIRPYLSNALFEPRELSVTVTNVDLENCNFIINRAPILESIGEKQIPELGTLSFNITATDPDLDEITYSVENLPDGATFTDQEFSWRSASGQAGTYYVTFKVTDINNLTDTEKVKITVEPPDTTAPSIVSVTAFFIDPTKVSIIFSEPVEKNSAEDILNYTIDNEVTILDALLGTDTKTVILTTSILSEGINYILTVNNVTDLSRNPIATNSQQTFFLVGLRTGLIGYWNFDEGTETIAFDSSGNANDGTISEATYTQGKDGFALNFDGTNDGVEIPDKDNLSPHLGADGEMTVTAWVKIPQLPLSSGQGRIPVIAKGSADNWEYAVYIYSDGRVGLTNWKLSGNDYCSVTGGTISLNQWHHLAGTLKKGQFARIYLDGNLISETTTFNADTGNGSSPFYIARRGDGQYFKGTIDEVRIYNRALSTSEIQALYGGTPLPQLPGDFDGDGDVDIQDLLIVAKGYGVTYNLQDLLLVAKHYGEKL